jgi:hypothetical protein
MGMREFREFGSYRGTIAMGVPLLVLGLLGLFGVRAASLILAIAYFAAGATLGIGSLFVVPFPWALINIVFGVLMMLPLVLILEESYPWKFNIRSLLIFITMLGLTLGFVFALRR